MLILIISIFFIIFILYLISIKSVSDQEGDSDIVMDMKQTIQPYSGINEDLFISYINNLDMFQKNIEFVDISSKYFYSAIENLYDIQLDDQDFDFSDKIEEIARTGEEMLLHSSLKHGTLFNPKYLNK
jgi:hypothetical protein